jgi:hypothetical protein
MAGKKLEENLACNVRDSGRVEHLRCHLVSSAGKRGRKSEHFACLGDVEAQAVAVARVDGELDLAFGNNNDTGGRFRLAKQHGACRIQSGMKQQFEIGQRRRG